MYQKSGETLYAELHQLQKEMDEWESRYQSLREYKVLGRAADMEELFLIGHEEKIAAVKEKFETCSLLFLYGQGGMGKSAVAKAYARQFQDQYETIIFASCEFGIQRMLADDTQIQIQGLSYQPSGKRGELGWYCRKKLQLLQKLVDCRTLLILDNLDKREERYLGRIRELPCHVLITTRVRPVSENSDAVEILPLKREEQRQLFEHYYGKKLSEEKGQMAENLLDCLSGNTLRIKQLGLYCAKKRFRCKKIWPIF